VTILLENVRSSVNVTEVTYALVYTSAPLVINVKAGNTKAGSITVLLTSCLTGLD